MSGAPFDLLRCSWPRPVAESERCWTSDPEWDAPLTGLRPEPCWRELNGELCWTLDWRVLFHGQLRRFHIVFQIRINRSGTLRFREDDGSIIRREGQILHNDRGAHGPCGSDLPVAAGDLLEIAQWQFDGEWLWGARLLDEARFAIPDYLPAVRERLRIPDGPPLKIYTAARYPLRTITAVYSLILNGYVPEAVHIYGDYQWLPQTRILLQGALPFARVVSCHEVLAQIRRAGGAQLAHMAEHHWFVMKSCISLICSPHEFCLMDDDVLILDSLRDALSMFASADFVYTPDVNHGELYASIWSASFSGQPLHRATNLNTGLYWLRHGLDPGQIARVMLAGEHQLSASWAWEQGLFAYLFHDTSTCMPSQRYLYPLMDGVPAGIDAYPYAQNPCGFASIHFGGPVEKPDDTIIERIAPQLLGRNLHDPGNNRNLLR